MTKDEPRHPTKRALEQHIANLEQELAACKLRQHELQSLFDLSPDMLCIAGTDGYFKRINPAFQQTLGFNDVDLLAQPFLNFIHPDDRAATVTEVAKLTAGRPMLYFENRYRRKNGTYCWLAWTAHTNADEGLMYASARDITSQKKTERERTRTELALRKSEGRLRSVITQVPLILWAIDNDGVFTFSEGRALKGLGFEPGQVVGQSVFDLYGDFPAIIDATRRVLAGEEQRYMTLVDGHNFENWYSPLYDEQGNQTGASGVAIDLTERENAKAQLENSLSLLQSTLESTADGILVVDRDGAIVRFNEKFLDMWGYAEALLDGQDAQAILHITDRLLDPDDFIARVEAIYADPKAESFDAIYLKDGRIFERYSQPQRLGDQIVGRVWSFRDVTERRRAQDELVKRQNLLLSAERVANLGSWEWDLATSRVTYSDQLLHIVGLNPETFDGSMETVVAITHPDDREQVEQAIETVLRDGQVVPLEYRVIRPDGIVRTVLGIGSVTKDEHDQPVRVVGSVQDVTERKQAEEALHRSQHELAHANQMLQLIIDTIPVGVFWKDRDSVFLGSNPKTLQGLGLESIEEIIGKDDLDLFSKELADRFRADDANVIATGNKKLDFEESSVDAAGNQTWNRVSKVPLRDPHGEIIGVLGVYDDITEHKKAQEKLEKYAEALERSNQELEQFAYAASHDLQEPLRTIRSFVQLFQQRYQGQLDDSADQFLGFIVDGAERMQALIQDLLTYSHVGRKDIEHLPVDLNEVLGETLANLKSMLDHAHADVTFDTLPTVKADPTQIGLLLQNLVGNGVKFHGEAKPQVHVSATKKGRVWHIAIRDNGIGIKQEYQEHIFEVFKRLHSRAHYDGTGIGLAICKKIVERHQGRIWVESEEGTGATFHFTIPAR